MNCNYKHTDRTGLYIMVFLILLNSCHTDNLVNKIAKQVGISEQTQEQTLPDTK